MVEQVQEHLLNLVAAHDGRRRGLDLQLDLDAILLHLALQQHERAVDQLGQVGRHALLAAAAGQAEHAVGDFFSAGGGGEDFGQRFVARGFVFVPQAELGVVDDRREDVVEFVRRGAGQFAQRGHSSRMAQLVFEHLQLAFEFHGMVLEAGRLGCWGG